MGAPGFWDDQNGAARISTEHSRATRKLERYERLRETVEDNAELYELDPSLEDEVATQLVPVKAELDRLQEEALFNGEYDGGDALVSITAGTGGTDAQDWAEMLLRMYLRWTDTRGFTTELLEASPGEEAGLKSAALAVKGENAYGLFKAERGVHRLVRHSPFDSAHRRHTAFAQVVVAPLLPDSAEIEIDESELRIDTYRASGAGGQHVNKTDSAVRITHLPTGIVVQCQNERSQLSNKATAMRLLRSRLAEQQEEEREAELARERGGKVDVGFGSQIRSYVLQPYQMVKDHRTDFEMGNAQGVLDGDLDGFVQAYLLAKAAGEGT
jgi:peptide chain release factor 2